ncbi:MAG: hypothetical protein U0556_13035 [Dehalococcoidia bacterium]
MAFDPSASPDVPVTRWGLVKTLGVVVIAAINVVATFVAIFTVPFVLFGSVLVVFVATQLRHTREVRRRDADSRRTVVRSDHDTTRNA